jgi:hypothetical protein
MNAKVPDVGPPISTPGIEARSTMMPTSPGSGAPPLVIEPSKTGPPGPDPTLSRSSTIAIPVRISRARARSWSSPVLARDQDTVP